MEAHDTSSVERFLQPFLPRPLPPSTPSNGVFVTATWAQSLDARIAAAPGHRTQLSGLYTKKMTHYLRTQHDGILVGKNTVLADNPSLSARYAANNSSPRPIILDTQFSLPLLSRSWRFFDNVQNGSGLGPWVVVEREPEPEAVNQLRALGGDFVVVNTTRDWKVICGALAARGLRSLMVEGGAEVLASCLNSGVVSSAIVTCAPVWLGAEGVAVAPPAELRPEQTAWWTTDTVPDAVYAARF